VDVATHQLAAASSLSLKELAALFTDAYEGYPIPMHIDAAGLARMIETNDLDLDAARIAQVDGEPAGICVLAVRGDEGWIGGMGVVPQHRREGIGEALIRAVLEEACRRSVQRVRLEVIQQNDAARLLYEKLGFELLRDVSVWMLDAEAGDDAGRDVPAEEAQAFVRAHRSEPEPWQRADGTLAHLDELAGVAVEGAAAVYRDAGGRVLMLQAAARDGKAATALVRALRARGSALIVVNLPQADVCAGALARLGGRIDVRQHEMALELHRIRGQTPRV
jgi:ribosomal protein S18 acetylase RimI-like enzyme